MRKKIYIYNNEQGDDNDTNLVNNISIIII